LAALYLKYRFWRELLAQFNKQCENTDIFILCGEDVISLIAAMAHKRVIGADNQMPWHLPADLKHFKQLTLGKPVIMGRKTHETVGKALPGRRNIVVSRQADLVLPDGCELVASLDEALELVADAPEIMVIGGAQIYKLAMPKAQRMYLTFIDLNVEGDMFFPAWNESLWFEGKRERHSADDKNPHHYEFVTLEKKV